MENHLTPNQRNSASPYGKPGSGIQIRRHATKPLADALHAVVADWQMVHPEREIDAVIWIERCVRCDRQGVQHLLSDLLENALKYGAPQSQVTVNCLTEGLWLTLSVHNFGTPIDLNELPGVFQPQVQSFGCLQLHHQRQSLRFCHEIARAHGGRLEISSNPMEGTLFRVCLPVVL